MDLFSQAEHDELAQAILVSPDAALLDAVAASAQRQIGSMPRRGDHRRVVRRPRRADQDPRPRRGLRDRRIASPRSTWNSRSPIRRRCCRKIRHAGAIFMGHAHPSRWAITAPGPTTCCRRGAPRASRRRWACTISRSGSSLLAISPAAARSWGRSRRRWRTARDCRRTRRAPIPPRRRLPDPTMAKKSDPPTPPANPRRRRRHHSNAFCGRDPRADGLRRGQGGGTDQAGRDGKSRTRSPRSCAREIAAAAADVPINRYPDGNADAVKAALRQAYDIPASAGAASSAMAPTKSSRCSTLRAGAAGRRDAGARSLLRHVPDERAVRQAALRRRAAARRLRARSSTMLEAIAREQPALVLLAYPNNPTGNLFAAADVERDPARRAGPRRRRRGLLRVRGRQFPAAGARVPEPAGPAHVVEDRPWPACGWATRSPPPRGPPNSTRSGSPIIVNALTQAVAPVLLRHRALLAGAGGGDPRRARAPASALAVLPGVIVFPTQTNFVLARVPDAPGWFAALAAARHTGEEPAGTHPLLDTACASRSAHPPKTTRSSTLLATLPMTAANPAALARRTESNATPTRRRLPST